MNELALLKHLPMEREFAQLSQLPEGGVLPQNTSIDLDDINFSDGLLQLWLDAQTQQHQNTFPGLVEWLRKRAYVWLTARVPLLPSFSSENPRDAFLSNFEPLERKSLVLGVFDVAELGGYVGRVARGVLERKRIRESETLGAAVLRAFCIRELEASKRFYEATGTLFAVVEEWEAEETTTMANCHFAEILKILTSAPLDKRAVDFVDYAILMAIAERADSRQAARVFFQGAVGLNGFIQIHEQRHGKSDARRLEGNQMMQTAKADKIAAREAVLRQLMVEYQGKKKALVRVINDGFPTQVAFDLAFPELKGALHRIDFVALFGDCTRRTVTRQLNKLTA